MKGLRRLLLTNFALGVVSVGFFVLERHAMNGTFQPAAPNLPMEWRVVSLGFLLILTFHVLLAAMSLVAFGRLRSRVR